MSNRVELVNSLSLVMLGSDRGFRRLQRGEEEGGQRKKKEGGREKGGGRKREGGRGREEGGGRKEEDGGGGGRREEGGGEREERGRRRREEQVRGICTKERQHILVSPEIIYSCSVLPLNLLLTSPPLCHLRATQSASALGGTPLFRHHLPPVEPAG